MGKTEDNLKINNQEEPADEVEGHGKFSGPEGRNSAPAVDGKDDDENEVEGHARFTGPKSS
jgi:hypothetical protein